MPHERVIATVDRHANTSAASIPLALDEAVRDGRIRAGHRVLLIGVGGGFTWGSVFLDIDDDADRIRVSGAGLAGGRDDGGLRRHPRCARRSTRRRGPRPGSVGARHRGSGGRPQPDRQYAAGDADGGRCRLARVAGRGRARAAIASPDTASANTRRWSRRARSPFAMRCRWCAFAPQAMQEAVPAGVGAMAAILGLDAAALAAVCAEARRDGPGAWSSPSISMARSRS